MSTVPKFDVGTAHAVSLDMTKPRFYRCKWKPLRVRHETILELATEMHALETKLIALLQEADRDRLFVWCGYNSLTGYCTSALKFSRIQSQRIVTRTRRLGHHADVELPDGKDLNSTLPIETL